VEKVIRVANQSPVILAMDTAGPICSVSLLIAGQCHTLRSNTERRHARELLPMISSLLTAQEIGFADISALAVVRGPGSFTGLRIGSAVAQGLAFGNALPVISVSYLELMAEVVPPNFGDGLLLVVMLAREGEYYYSLFRCNKNTLLRLTEDAVGDCAAIAAALATHCEAGVPVNGVGDGFVAEEIASLAVQDRFGAVLASVIVDSEALALAAVKAWHESDFSAAEAVMPVYLKEDMAYRRSGE